MFLFATACSNDEPGRNIAFVTLTPDPNVDLSPEPTPAPTLAGGSNLTSEQVFKIAAARIPIFRDNISLSIQVIEARGDRLLLEAAFRNLTEIPIMFRVPGSASFPPEDVCELTDLVLEIRNASGAVLPLFETGLENCYPDWGINDFTSIRQGDVLETQFPVILPNPLGNGSYQISAAYNNLVIGPYNVEEWIDLNAWVGVLESNRIDFQIPTPSE
ncbi:MAG: hypothetical protein FVQ83_01270 [Chloroflexi bacterium]|nr:hypothetical protein [Chloroflexota bacterium]